MDSRSRTPLTRISLLPLRPMVAIAFGSPVTTVPDAARWSPDGKQVAVEELLSGQNAKLRTISADGGTSTEQIPDDPEDKLDVDWSPDGTKIIFGNGPANPNSKVQLLDMNTHQRSTVPGSTGLYSSRWSPDGRYIVAMNFN